MLRGIRNAQARFARQRFHGSRRLAQEIEQFQPGWTRYGFSNAAKLFINRFPRRWSWHLMRPGSF
jgi:hypothetical protein